MHAIQWRFVLFAQLLALGASIFFVQSGFSAALSAETIRSYSGTLTLLMLLLGFGSLRWAGKKRVVPSLWILALAAIAPAFAYFAGPIEGDTQAFYYLISYQLLGLLLQAFMLFKQHRHLKAELNVTKKILHAGEKNRESAQVE